MNNIIIDSSNFYADEIKKIKIGQNYEILNMFNLHDVLPFLVNPFMKHHGKIHTRCYYPDSSGQIHSVNMKSYRLWTFHVCGVVCVSCGICGKVFLLERDCGNKNGPPHLNLYAVDQNNKLILMTKDHITPKSKGGRDIQANFQTMCTICNGLKGNN